MSLRILRRLILYPNVPFPSSLANYPHPITVANDRYYVTPLSFSDEQTHQPICSPTYYSSPSCPRGTLSLKAVPKLLLSPPSQYHRRTRPSPPPRLCVVRRRSRRSRPVPPPATRMARIHLLPLELQGPRRARANMTMALAHLVKAMVLLMEELSTVFSITRLASTLVTTTVEEED